MKDTIIILYSTKSNDKTNTKRTHSKHIKIKKYIYKWTVSNTTSLELAYITLQIPWLKQPKKLKSPISDISSAPTLELPRHSSIQSLPYNDDDYESTVKCIFCHQHIPLDVLEFHATTYHPKELTYYYCHRQTIQEQNENVTYVACRYHATTLNELNIHINSTHDYPVAETQYILTTQ